LIAAACALRVAFHFIRDRRPLAAGLTLAFGYLFHPLAILSAPFLALWLLAEQKAGGWMDVAGQLAWSAPASFF